MGKTIVVLALLVILAGAVFAVSAMRPASDVSKWQETVAGVFGGWISDPLTPDDVDVRSGNCAVSGAVLTVPPGGRCMVTIVPSDQLLRRGALQVGHGPVRIDVTQSRYGGPAKTVAAGERYDLNIERDGETVLLICRDTEACRLTLEASR